MQLEIRPAEFSLPSYSLTSDLLGFLRCGLQYRYTRIGQLPASRPVQLWFGQYIHGVLEEAYRRYDLAGREGRDDTPPWTQDRIDEICDLVTRRLAAQRLFPWSLDLEELGNARATAAINDLGPELFPLIHRAEIRLTGTRALPITQIPAELRFREADRYEMVGVIDVITHIELNDLTLQDNQLLGLILGSLPTDVPEQFEVIIDYKGMRRPPITNGEGAQDYWDTYAWQTQTYAHLRSTHEDSLPIVAGVIIYLNELHPTRNDMERLKREIKEGRTDVVPEPGSQAEVLINSWRRTDDPPQLPVDFRLARAIRIVPTTEEAIVHALQSFDDVVGRIEVCRGRELQQGRVLTTWETNSEDDQTCTRCDSRTYCPDYDGAWVPSLPGARPT